MGLFDSVIFPCPTDGCDGEIEIQSKAGDCYLATYSPDDVPVAIAADIAGESAWCPKCSRSYTVTKSVQETVSVHLVSSRDVCQHCGK